MLSQHSTNIDKNMPASTNKYVNNESGSIIPTSRSSRLANIARLAAGITGNVVSEYAKQLSHGNAPELKDVLLTPTNAKRVAEKLMKMRGAALKVGQLLAMDNGDFIPPELSHIFDKLKDDVEPMPFSQLTALLNSEWGEDWHENFSQFTFTPMAAASIGQVHSAIDLNDKKLAIKIQYPGVEKSIDSDVDNVGTILKYSGLLPDTTKIKELLIETKQQLHCETDYIKEADWIDTYNRYLKNDHDFIVPYVYRDYTNKNILCMSYHEGENIDEFTHLSLEEKNHIVTSLIKLTFKEIFELHHVQTDPNFANYLYQEKSRKIVLLDFGATRKLPKHIIHGYKLLLNASIRNDKQGIYTAIKQIGFFQDEITATQREAVISIFELACQPLRHSGVYDFENSTLAKNVSMAGRELSFKQDYWHTPPADALFLHRKIAGLYLIAVKLKVKINLQELIQPYIDIKDI